MKSGREREREMKSGREREESRIDVLERMIYFPFL